MAKKQGRIKLLSTPTFRFLDFINYLGPAQVYEKWVKTYGSRQIKSWLPYEWFDCVDKLDYEGLQPYRCWFSSSRRGE